MKERPLLLNTEMVRAVLEGRKTQTRTPMSVQPTDHDHKEFKAPWRDEKPQYFNVSDNQWACRFCGEGVIHTGDSVYKCPYGKIGDRLWVRETFFFDTSKLNPDESDKDSIYYRADGECCQQIPECACSEVGKPKWKPSIHMPRWASRIILEVTDIRVERIQDISEQDILAEGVKERIDCNLHGQFKNLWQSLYGDSWDRNEWVWVCEFKVISTEG